MSGASCEVDVRAAAKVVESCIGRQFFEVNQRVKQRLRKEDPRLPKPLAATGFRLLEGFNPPQVLDGDVA